MSVEDAWKPIARYLNAREFACLDGSHTDAMRDRLILEAQAEMPCYWTEGECAQTPCPSCQAREKLKVPA